MSGLQTMPESMTDVLGAGDKIVRLVDPRTRAEYVLMPVAAFDELMRVLDDDPEQRAWREMGVRTLAERYAEDERDPAG